MKVVPLDISGCGYRIANVVFTTRTLLGHQQAIKMSCMVYINWFYFLIVYWMNLR